MRPASPVGPSSRHHADAVEFAVRHPGFAVDGEALVQHWRCGNDIEYSLRVAGFSGVFHMFDDPMVMGPVPALPEDEYWRTRAGYLDDLMFHALLWPLIDVPRPLLQEGQGDTWTRRLLRLKTLGEQMLAGQAHWLDQAPEVRWVGGVRIVADQAPWVVSREGRVWRR